MRSKAKAWLGVALVVILPIIAELTQLKLPIWARFAMLMVWTIVVIFLALVIIADWFGWRSGPKSFSSRRANMMISIAGAIIGAIVAPLVWGIIPHDEDDPEVAAKPNPEAMAAEPAVAAKKDRTALVIPRGAIVKVSMSPLMPDPNQTPADPNDLEFYFFALTAAAYENWVQYADVTVTNRSPRKMHLELWGQVDYWKDSGEPSRYGMRAEWNPDGLKERTGQDVIDLDAWETKKGRLLLFLGEPDKRELSQWFLDANQNVYFELFDSVTGKRIAFKGTSGYPVDQMPSPLPSPKELLTLDFPGVPETAREPLGLLLRTRDRAYDGTKFMVDALLKNLSPKPMELEVNLLIRNLAVENNWHSSGGLFRDLSAKGSPDIRTVGIEPGTAIVRHLTFDLAALGVPTGGWNLRDQPKDTLIEINDLKSGEKVWCAIHPGYPPGTDMRSASIRPHEMSPLENPVPDSDNPPRAPANDPQ